MINRTTLKLMAKVGSAAAIPLLVILALGPAKWAPRTALGWQVDHFLGYLAITSMVCMAWPRPFVVGGALMTFAALLEGLQAFTPDRSANVVAAMCGAGGALLSSLPEHGSGLGRTKRQASPNHRYWCPPMHRDLALRDPDRFLLPRLTIRSGAQDTLNLS